MNIEKTISEQAVSDILTPMLESQDRIVTEDVAPLFDQATGLDTPPASGTVTTTIEESRSVITAIIRKAWMATLTMLGGASVIGYIAAAYTYLRNRLQGNETYGIPDRRSEISASSPLAANLALLNDRKIGGVPEAEDGMSLVNLLTTDARLSITELQDDNRGGALTSNAIFSLFPNVTKAVIGGSSYSRASGTGGYNGYIKSNNTLKEVYFPGLTSISLMPNDNGLIYSCDNLEIVECENLDNIVSGYVNTAMFWGNQPKLWKLKLGKITGSQVIFCGNSGAGSRPKLIHLELGAGTNVSLPSLQYWNPSYILSDNPTGTDLIEEGSTAQNNLQQFLQNFRDYIALRLTDNGSGKTITLSQAVRNAIHAAEATYHIENIIITNKGWTISPAPN